MESSKCHLGAVIVRDLSMKVSNYRSVKTLDQYLKEQKVMGIANVDTRAITRRLRATGCLNGVITTGEICTCSFSLYSARPPIVYYGRGVLDFSVPFKCCTSQLHPRCS